MFPLLGVVCFFPALAERRGAEADLDAALHRGLQGQS